MLLYLNTLEMSDVASLKKHLQKYGALKQEISKVIVGQDAVIEQILISIFSGGHSLLVGVPGLAKTLMVVKTSGILVTKILPPISFKS